MRYRTGLLNPRPMTHLPHWSALKCKYGRSTPPPGEIDYLRYLPDDIGMMGNNIYGDCFWAASYHARQVRTLFATGTMETEPDSIVLGAYSAATGFRADQPTSDQGTDPGEGFSWMLRCGLPTRSTPVQIIGAIELDPRQPQDSLEALDYCGGLLVGVSLPKSFVALDDPPDVWDWAAGDTDSGEGHEIYLGRADPSWQDIGIVSWGKTHAYSLTPAFWSRAVTQCTAIIARDWVEVTGKTPFGMTLDQLAAEISAHSSGPIP